MSTDSDLKMSDRINCKSSMQGLVAKPGRLRDDHVTYPYGNNGGGRAGWVTAETSGRAAVRDKMNNFM